MTAGDVSPFRGPRRLGAVPGLPDDSAAGDAPPAFAALVEELELEMFWRTRPVLAHLHAFARARRVAPWALLGVTLA